MAENDEIEKIYLQLKAISLIKIIPLVYGVDLNRDNFEKVLYLVYGLNSKEAQILRDTARGKICKFSSKVIENALEEFVKFLNATGYIVSVKIFLEEGIDEFCFS